ncbi:adenylate/guanylate cyclase domain-containing protein [Tistrella bauzanensis]|uniref:adenylate/guanylate cyclase domain-containing protein n=1 Tax=Tistrella TaxID=171436 RepID=UPI0031F634F5
MSDQPAPPRRGGKRRAPTTTDMRRVAPPIDGALATPPPRDTPSADGTPMAGFSANGQGQTAPNGEDLPNQARLRRSFVGLKAADVPGLSGQLDPVAAGIVAAVADRMARDLLHAGGFEAVFEGMSAGLAARGVPVKRAYIAFRTLHPLIAAVSFLWQRGHPVERMVMSHELAGLSEVWKRSPFNYMLTNNVPRLRRRLIDPDAPRDFEVLNDLMAEGTTDYLAAATAFGGGAEGNGVIASWTTDAADGFSDLDLSVLDALQVQLALACRLAFTAQVAETVAMTYLGNHAGRRVLSGQIRRGDGELIPAAIFLSDLRGSTGMAEKLGVTRFMELVNRYFECAAEPVLGAGGEVLTLMGDSVLAIFPLASFGDDVESACDAALAAARDAERRLEQWNRARRADGEVAMDFGIGLHLGRVMFGNIGTAERLQFTAIDRSINEAARLEGLTKSMGHRIIASGLFARRASAAWRSLGHVQLRGSAREQEVFTPAPAANRLALAAGLDVPGGPCATPPQLVVHADWSVDARKRWMAVAARQPDGGYLAGPPEPVGPVDSLIDRLIARAGGGRVMLGLDVVLGLPAGYAERIGVTGFREAIARIASDPDWAAALDPAATLDEVSLSRPFFPRRAGSRSMGIGKGGPAALAARLGLDGPDDLRRICDHATTARRAAAPLFWTMGPAQVGRAAAHAWRHLLLTKGEAGRLGLWPFDGPLDSLLANNAVTLVEAYPAEFHRHLGVRMGRNAGNGRGSKRNRDDRAANAPMLIEAGRRMGLTLDIDLVAELGDGFGDVAAGEDRFDAVIGMMGMLQVLAGDRPTGEPRVAPVVTVEGWILGQSPAELKLPEDRFRGQV